MTDDNARNNNQRVTNALLRHDLDDISKKLDVLPDIQNKLHDIDTCVKVVAKDVERNKEDIDVLQKKSNINDIIIATGTVVAGIVGSIFGGQR